MAALRHENFVDGAWLTGSSNEFQSENPANGEIIWSGNAADSNDVLVAISAAKKAFASWKLLSFDERKAFVDSFIERIKERTQELAEAIHIETGKPLWESKTEIATMIGKAAISVNAYQDRTGATEKEANNVAILLAHRPIGVFAVLGPYNFPGHLPNGHIIPALLAGNTIVFKPSELTPMIGELMVQCWEEAGIPAGVINLVQGARETGEALVNAAEIDGVLFTGSSKTGHAIHAALAGQPHKMLALEMGGNNPLVVDEVKDIDAAVYTIIQSAFISAGQRCTCARRLILVDNESNKNLLDKLIVASKQIKVGSDDDCFIGPVVSNTAAENVQAFEKALLERGATTLLAVVRRDENLPFLQPSLIDVTNASKVQDEECFGPLLQVKWVENLDAAIDEANNTRYGLSAGLLSDNGASWDMFYSRIRAGIVNYNRQITGASGAAPFGGVGASGNFRPGAYYAADYSAYPIASMASDSVELPEKLAPGISL
ncbi:MAG: succinylglutamate-semialdehyde dehydrogenase [Gammaproteobacteria bacterium]|nr:succinylglutamate-semialdehyde dehydrogenase [Gammaproteobacteria bacterium]